MHLQIIDEVFRRLQDAVLYVNINKTNFIRQNVKYLGSVISLNKIEPDPTKIRALCKGKVPADEAEIRTFLGAAGYLRPHILNFSVKAEPLTRLLNH